MKFKLQNWLLGFLIFLTLVPSWVSAYIPKNTRQGSEVVFSILRPETSRESSELQPVSRSFARKIATGTLFMLKDGLGSTIALTGKDAKAVARINYDAWGNFRWNDRDCHQSPCNENDLDNYLERLENTRGFGHGNHNGWAFGKHFAGKLTPYLYTGRRYSPFTGQYNNRNRYYSPALGRFVSKDPIGFAADINLYRYADNNPVLYTDPFGNAAVLTFTLPRLIPIVITFGPTTTIVVGGAIAAASWSACRSWAMGYRDNRCEEMGTKDFLKCMTEKPLILKVFGQPAGFQSECENDADKRKRCLERSIKTSTDCMAGNYDDPLITTLKWLFWFN